MNLNLNLIPNIEPYDKYINYFKDTADTPATSDDYIYIPGTIPTQEEVKKDPPKKASGAIQLISPRPEVIAKRQEEELKRKKETIPKIPTDKSKSGPPAATREEGPEEATIDLPPAAPKKGRKRKKTSSKILELPDIYNKR